LQVKSIDVLSSAEWLAEGKILIHPTEGVWGIGCDALNKSSFQKVYDLKKRPRNKSFILLIKSFESIRNYLVKLDTNDLKYIEDVWPGHTTLLIKYNEKLPEHLKNESGKVALRVSNHYPINTLFKAFNGILVSTSANLSGEPNIENIDDILSTFAHKDVAHYDDKLGNNKKPSRIIDLESRTIIRD